MRLVALNSFVVHCGGDSPPGKDVTLTRYGALEVRQRPVSDAGRLHVLENEQYTLLLRGHFYCEVAKTLDAMENLKLLLEEVSAKGSLAKALPMIAGGMFGLFALNRRTGKLEATVDRLAGFPLYFHESNGRVEFSNNQFAFPASLSDVAICEFLKYGYLPFSASLFEGVQRLKPGEIVTAMPGAPLRRCQTAAPSHTYLPLAERVQTREAGAEALAAAFDRYFARLGRGGVSGLSGGYDSRLIAAYCAEKGISFVNFGNPLSREVRIAHAVARRLGRPIEGFRIPDDAVARHGDRFPQVMTALDSFEDAHVFELVDRAKAAAYYVDGYIGDTIVGGNYFSKLADGLRGMIRPNRFESAPLPSEDYVAKLYGNKRAVPDEALGGLITTEIRNAIQSLVKPIVESHRQRSPTHEDLIESLTHAIRGVRLIAGGPTAVASAALTACPFIDRTVFETAMNCAKNVRAGDRLYNALWRRRFPELADIPKNNTGGRPAHSDVHYRLKHLQSAIRRRVIDPRLKKLTRGRWDRSESYAAADTYLANPATQKYLHELIDRSANRLPPRIADALLKDYSSGTLAPLVSLRFGTLLACLG